VLSEQLNKSNGREKFQKKLRDAGFSSKAENFSKCKNDQVVLRCKDCGKHHFYTKTCQLSVCPKCENSKRFQIVKRYEKLANSMENPKQIDLTVENYKELSKDHIQELRDYFTKLRDKYDFKGGLYTLEIVNKGRGWNIHIHALIDTPYISQERLSNSWEEITGDPVVYIQKVGSPKRSLRYITKYITKPPELQDMEQGIDYIEATNNLRLLATFGDLYDMSPKELPAECPSCGSEDLEWIGSMSFWSSFMSGPQDSDRNKGPPDLKNWL